MEYELDDIDRRLIAKVKDAVEQVELGSPLKDFIDDDEIFDALVLLTLMGAA